jgi:hypothetical protein
VTTPRNARRSTTRSPDPRGASGQRDDGSPRPPRVLPPGHTARRIAR